VSNFIRTPTGKILRALTFGVLTLAAAASTASASGQRSTELTESLIESFAELTPEEFAQQSLHYVGSTLKWHVMMRVDTSVGGGRPSDRLSAYKVDANAVTIVNGWGIHFSDRQIYPRDCPTLQPASDAPRKWIVPANDVVRQSCTRLSEAEEFMLKVDAALRKGPQAAYDEAYNALQKSEFDRAERSFEVFAEAYPTHQLAGNAQYWRGDIAFSQRKDFAASAELFGEGYEKYPEHSKAPEMLYRMGASFDRLNRTDQACGIFALLSEEYPRMPGKLKTAAAKDRRRLGCR
jgi:tol-pal system protein YbgF